ncbi:hypothetical protein Dimus_019290 [Dionaea muscipula]
MWEKNVVQWTSKIMSYSRKGLTDKALACFLQMRRASVEPNETTLSTTLTVCAHSMDRETFGVGLHCLAFKNGYLKHLFVSCGLIGMYSKCGDVHDARKLFDEIPERDAVVWNSMISAYSQRGWGEEACSLFSNLTADCKDWNVLVNDFTLASVLNACAQMGFLGSGQCVHGFAIKTGFNFNVFVGGSIVDMYCRCGRVSSARCAFDGLENRDVVVWNTMIARYAQSNCGEEALELFHQMERYGIPPNDSTFSCIIQASRMMPDSALVRCFHAKTLQLGFSSDLYVGTALVDLYSKFLAMEDAEKAFHGISKTNLVSYNALINGYGLVGGHVSALIAYKELRLEEMKPDSCTLLGLFSSCAASGAFVEGAQVHCHSILLALDLNVTVANSIVNFYSSCGRLDCALRAFDSIEERNAISWAGMISGLVQHNQLEKAIELFREMHMLYEITDEFTASSVIKVAGTWANIEQGRIMHAHVMKMGLENKIFVGSSLIVMYSKCGMVEDAYSVFCTMPEKNVVSWNSMIMGYAQNGFSNDALILYQEMNEHGVSPTAVTFVGILLACTHARLVEDGKHYYRLMTYQYGIPSSLEHCTCMVNLLSRAGYVEEAEEFLLCSPFTEEPGIWRGLLASSEACENFHVAYRAAHQCLHLEPNDSFAHTILSNINAAKHLWSEVGMTRDSMKVIGVTKEPGYSWIGSRD